nr:unnamed protein product [Digitaria exilis]
MGEPNSNDNAMVHDSEMVDGNGVIHGNEMVHGSEMIHDNEIIHGDEMMHGNEMIQGTEMIEGSEMIQVNDLIHGHEMVQVNDMVNGDEMGHGNELINAGMTPQTTTRRRRKKSLVWEHFTIENMPGGSSRACCNLCKQTFAYSSGSKIAGTSHLKRHITLGSCPVMKDHDRKLALPPPAGGPGTDNDGEGTVERPSKRKYRYTGYANATFDQERSFSHLAKMIILHDYPLHIVQQSAFNTFIDSLQPRFRIVDVDTMEREVYAVFQRSKENLLQAFSTMPGRISLTIGLWTTTQTLGYVSLAGQFIDSEWKIPSTKTLCLDVTTQWNTTYLMLLAALDYKQAFTTLETCDDNYNEAPSAEDWKRVEASCNYLKLLYDSAHSIMAAANPTANIFFHEAWKIQQELAIGTGHEDPVFSSIAKDMHERFDKYWKDCSLVLAIAVVMDPRFKMKLVEFSYSKIYGAEVGKYVKVVNDSLHEMYKEYVAQPLSLTPAYGEQGDANNMSANGNAAQGNPPSTSDGLLDFDMW